MYRSIKGYVSGRNPGKPIPLAERQPTEGATELQNLRLGCFRAASVNN